MDAVKRAVEAGQGICGGDGADAGARVAIVRLWTTGGASALRLVSCRAAGIPSGRR
jgi:hypothetical protein